jgi:geranylgeranyl pyrophosphate synthase
VESVGFASRAERGRWYVCVIAACARAHGAARADDSKWATVSSEFDAATLALCGQFLDLSFESRFDVSVDEYLRMIRGKTAALIEAAARFGAILATDDAPHRDT